MRTEKQTYYNLSLNVITGKTTLENIKKLLGSYTKYKEFLLVYDDLVKYKNLTQYLYLINSQSQINRRLLYKYNQTIKAIEAKIALNEQMVKELQTMINTQQFEEDKIKAMQRKRAYYGRLIKDKENRIDILEKGSESLDKLLAELEDYAIFELLGD